MKDVHNYDELLGTFLNKMRSVRELRKEKMSV